MANWLGKYWPLRLALWLFAAVLCFGIWPVWALELASRELLVSYSYFDADQHAEFANPVLRRVGTKTIEAWDWKTGKRWPIATVTDSRSGFLPAVRDGHVQAVVAATDDDRIVVYDVAPPHMRRQFSVPETLGKLTPVLVDQETNVAVLAEFKGFSYRVHVADLTKGQVVYPGIEGWGVFAVGDRELEVVEAAHVGIQGLDPSFRSSTRWKLGDDGQLVASEKPSVIDADLFSEIRAHPSRLSSPDGRFEAVLVKGLRTEVRERSTDRLLEKIYVPPSNFLNNIQFSTESNYLLVGDANTNLQVFDLETQSLVADDCYLERKWWIANTLVFSSAAALIVTLALALRTSSFERAACDGLLASVYWDSVVTAMISQHEWFPPAYTGTVTAAAIGIYWTFGEQPFWRRIVCGALAIVIVYSSFLGIVSRSDRISFECTGIDIALTLYPILSSIAAWLMTLPTGWSLSRDAIAKAAPRFQFGIGSIAFTIAIAGVLFGLMRSIPGGGADQGEVANVVGRVAQLAAIFLVVLVIVWTFLWLVFRRFTWVSGMAIVSIAVAIFGLSMQQVVSESDFSKPFDMSQAASRFLSLAGPVTLMLIRFCFPLCLARRHGYRWVRATQSSPKIDGPIGAAT